MPVADSTRRKQSKPYPEFPLFAHRFLLGLIVAASVCAWAVMDRQKLRSEIDLLRDSNTKLQLSIGLLKIKAAQQHLAKEAVQIQMLENVADRFDNDTIDVEDDPIGIFANLLLPNIFTNDTLFYLGWLAKFVNYLMLLIIAALGTYTAGAFLRGTTFKYHFISAEGE